MDFLKRIIIFMLIPAMAHAATTPLMNMSLPVPGTTLGPTWASMLNTALTTVDSHNHTLGYGARIPTAGLNINADLSLSSFNLYNVKSSKYLNNASALGGASDVRSVYSVLGDLYYNNGSGTPIKLTSGNTMNVASLGVIGGDYGGSNPAAVNYADTTKTYSFTQSTGKTANLSTGPVSIFENAVSAPAITLQSPSGLGAAYALTLPTAQASANNVMKANGSGQLSFSQVLTTDVADSAITTVKIAANNVTDSLIQSGGLNTASLKDSSVTTVKIADGAVTPTKLAALGQQMIDIPTVTNASEPSNYSLGSVTITTTGRPVFVGFFGATRNSYFEVVQGIGASANADIKITRDSLEVGGGEILNAGTNYTTTRTPPGSIYIIDAAPAGTHTYGAYLYAGTNNYCSVIAVRMIAYEL